jgi:hypothetical protein
MSGLTSSSRVSISHPLFVSRNTKHSETKQNFAKFRLFRETTNCEISFCFVKSKISCRKFGLFSFREFHLPVLSFIYLVVSHLESVKQLLHFNVYGHDGNQKNPLSMQIPKSLQNAPNVTKCNQNKTF